ncbi:conjugation system SOS inhibitor PsiB [Serratia fonticola]|uniref:Conjugation system SOS inhibitor PsiB n=1 Tax=Serratia fonticola TaxID=47917 RepID=A0AAW3WVJ6_SERFO|nr:conjugation system SOS inhibitor PsiB [Serratia fonticola]MBC3214750.1 conjugation system SOS inhibitor PsiB [Serratia fonticola]NYA15857.1 conjugation system SOS inhibitor PsiB [Serratia fonticola]NYA35671.1 conjugation system SOS inhibitor PsiB [Serratia fonticola]
MNMPNCKLTTMIGEDYETCRAAGYSYRREMTHTVMGALTTPENWDVNGEYRSEFGGLFPVQIRFAPTHGRYEIVLCSPGEFSQNWIILLVWKQGQEVSCIRSTALFDSTVISHVLSLINRLDSDGYSIFDILATLRMEVA